VSLRGHSARPFRKHPELYEERTSAKSTVGDFTLGLMEEGRLTTTRSASCFPRRFSKHITGPWYVIAPQNWLEETQVMSYLCSEGA